MTTTELRLEPGRPLVVGSFGDAKSLGEADPSDTRSACDLVEVRLDLLPGRRGGSRPWEHLAAIPLLFTARRGDEGGAGELPAAERQKLIEAVLADAACFDIEVASIGEMSGIIATLAGQGTPWIASYHDFSRLPDSETLRTAAVRARDAGASAFKVAAKLENTADLARLADFQLADHDIPVASMGMGPLAPVSRLLCAQCGSVLNYGFLGDTPTAPGQWDAALLKTCIARSARFPGPI